MSNSRSVSTAYQAAYDKAMTLSAGDIVQYVRKATEWEGWLWCTDQSGFSAWVPEASLTILNGTTRGTAEATRDYTSRELTVEAGESVEVLREESGWFWVRAVNGSEGWVPGESFL